MKYYFIYVSIDSKSLTTSIDYYCSTRSPVGSRHLCATSLCWGWKKFWAGGLAGSKSSWLAACHFLLHSSKLQTTLLLLWNNIFLKNNFISFLDTFLHLEDEQNGLKKFSPILDNFSNHPNFFYNLIFNRSSKFQVFWVLHLHAEKAPPITFLVITHWNVLNRLRPLKVFLFRKLRHCVAKHLEV